MRAPVDNWSSDLKPEGPEGSRGQLFRKYVALFVAVVAMALIASGLLDMWFSYREQRALLLNTQREQASAAAAKIGQFVEEIERQMGWMTQLPWSTTSIDEWRFDAVRLLRQVPAITEISQLDSAGREQALVSRVAADNIGSQTDYSQDPKFVEAVTSKHYYGPLYFRRESEPYMTLAIPGARREYGVVVAEVNLKFIWDVVSQIKVGNRGKAYVVDANGRLIAHPDINPVLRNTDLSHLSQVRAARGGGAVPASDEQVVNDLQGERVLAAYSPVPRVGWLLFVELPVVEAYAPIYASLLRSVVLFVAALSLAVLAGTFLARRMVVPIKALRDGAARIGSGDLNQRITIKTGDELEALGDQFNSMAAQLQDSHATLERKVEERTQQLEMANLAKSRFLAAASHDLRQPLHALGLFVAQLRPDMSAQERGRIVERINASVAAMNELFNALLDISKVDAGALTPNVMDFPVAQLLQRIEHTFAEPARAKGVSLRVLPSDAWVRSDFILLERILLNLVSNAVRYTLQGGVVVACRKRGEQLRIEVWDTGPGIAEDQRGMIFTEFYRVGDPDRDQGTGLGLGLAIVDRFCALLGLPIELASVVGKGSRFAVVASRVPAQMLAERPVAARAPIEVSNGKLVVVIDDDPPVLEGMRGLLRSWGCRVVSGDTATAAMKELDAQGPAPDLVISDFRLPDGKTGIEAIEQVRREFGDAIPAFLISGDTHSEPLHQARASGLHLLHKPVDPMRLRAMVNRMVRKRAVMDATG
jgi:signal transduction histidine kinase/ActR/RegA family two-component response regulator